MKGFIFISVCFMNVIAGLSSKLQTDGRLKLSMSGGKDIPIRGFLLHQNEDVSQSRLKILQKMITERNDRLEAMATNMNKLDQYGRKTVTILKKLLLLDSKKDKELEKITTKIDELKKNGERSEKRLSSIVSNLAGIKQDVSDLNTRQKDGYIGCFKDDHNRHLKHKIANLGNAISLAKCRQHCYGYKYLGLQYRTFCLCGNELSVKSYPRVSDAECNMACAGESGRKCGGSSRNSIYTV